ncbi:MAG: DNA polymerase IV [Candidatus Omnitrophica bacterium]|nr:DNA polymerase IV [Candidatus Omnitrophota bacterium]
MVLHIDMDAFFASIEEAINPRLKGRPLIVGSRGNRMHTVVCAANYAAKALGIHSGMPTKRAYSIYSKLEFVAADQAKYIWTSEQIFELLKSFNLPLNYASIDEFQLELFGSPGPNPVNLGKEIKAQIYAKFNITASVGIAKNWLLAKLASKLDKPDGLTLIDDSNFEQVLRKASLDKLCGMGGKSGQILIAKGMKTCWDLYLNLPGFFDNNPGKFEEFDRDGSMLNGHINRIVPDKPKSISHSYTLPRSQINPQVIQAWIRLLSEMVAVRLRQQNLTSATVHLWLNSPEIGNFNAQKTHQGSTNDGYEICQRALKIMAKLSHRTPKIRAIGITCSNLSWNIYQPLLSEEVRREGLIRALDHINNRFGEGVIYPAVTALTR